MRGAPRVALFADTFHDINGAARTCREFQAFAERRDLPFFSVHAGPAESFQQFRNVAVLELPRGGASIGLDADLRFDPFFYRLRSRIAARLTEFQPDLVHLTSFGDFGIMGALEARRLGIPVALSWHTNVHEFARRRVERWVGLVPGIGRLVPGLGRLVEGIVWRAALWFYSLGSVLLAPNQELIDALHPRTRRPVFLMERGIDTRLFHPGRRTRTGDTFVMGFVGRLQPEKNVRFLAQVEAALVRAGYADFRFVIVGQGDERAWLEQNLARAEFTGVLTGAALADAYANMDVLVFPSHTDTYGNVIQEAAASGVPSIVTSSGGPKFLVQDGADGYVAANDEEFCRRALALMADRGLLRQMGQAARRKSESKSWDRVFEGVYEAYSQALGASLS